MENVKNINLSSFALSIINPDAEATNAVLGNFGKTSIADKFNKAVGGSDFTLKNRVSALQLIMVLGNLVVWLAN
ncbi:hypothetical protein ACFOW1_00005 [Parasediminibacterium paludis]|uniref:Uncharacterized protein n=1 Tax=Parasediminibacterium paludis TaxID=908966 RepID=A0ABV8PQA5_9BACT